MFAGICYELNDTISNSQVPSSGRQMSGRFVELLSKREVRIIYLIDTLFCFCIFQFCGIPWPTFKTQSWTVFCIFF